MRMNAVTRILLLIVVLAMGASLIVACGPNMEAAAEEGDLETLVEGLESNNVEVRRDAARMLGELEDPRAVPALIERLEEDEDEFVRAFAASALGDIGDERAIEPLQNALDDEDERVRDAAAASLDQLGAAAGN
jgi:HEAT repeat protein